MQLAYHLLFEREQLLTLGFVAPVTLVALHRSALVREAWTDIGVVGVGRRADLTLLSRK